MILGKKHISTSKNIYKLLNVFLIVCNEI